MNKLILSVKERIILPTLFPPTGGRVDMIIVAGLKAKTELTIEDVTEFELKDLPNGDITYNPKKLRDIEVEIIPAEFRVLKEICTRLDEKKLVTLEILPLLDKIDSL